MGSHQEYICPICKNEITISINNEIICKECNASATIEDEIFRFSKLTIQNNKKSDVYNFWNTAPNESLTVEGEKNTRYFFDKTEYNRYNIIHKDLDEPFFKKAIDFDQYKNLKILEVGCGIGMDSIQFARAGNDLTLLDLTFNSLQITRDRLQSEGYTANYIEADAENLPFKGETFDLVYSYGVIHHSPDTQKSINEIYRVLKPGGKAVVMLYHYNSAMIYIYLFLVQGIRLGYFFKYWSLQELLNRRMEMQSATDTNEPVLTQAFSRRKVRKMFRNYKKTTISTHYLTRGMLSYFKYLLPILPQAVKQKMVSWFGWNLIINATKS